MTPLSLRARTLPESAIRKLDQLVDAQIGVQFLRLNIGQPDIATPPSLLDAITSWRPQVVGYGPSSGTPACRQAAATYHAAWCPDLQARHVAVTTGGSEALLFAVTVVCDPGDEILVPEPFYTNYTGFAATAGVAVKAVPTHLEDGFALPSDEALDRMVGPHTRALLLSNPGNPTGAVYGADEIGRLIRWAARRGLFLISDEVYRRIWFDEPPASALSFDEGIDHVIVVDSLSKTFSACGIRLGFLLCRNPEIMERIDRLGQARLGPQPLAQVVAQAAFALPQSYFDTLRSTYARRITTLANAIEALPGVHAHRPQGAFYLMAELPVDDADAFARWMITDFRHQGETVVLAPGAGFYQDPTAGRRQVRLAAVLGEDRLQRAVQVLGLGLEAYALLQRDKAS